LNDSAHGEALLNSQLLAEFRHGFEVGLSIVGFIKNVEILLGQAHTPEAIGATNAPHAFDEVSAGDASLAFDGMGAPQA
jgi:hypothetical protein